MGQHAYSAEKKNFSQNSLTSKIILQKGRQDRDFSDKQTNKQKNLKQVNKQTSIAIERPLQEMLKVGLGTEGK